MVASTFPVAVVDDNEDDIDLTRLLLRKAGVSSPAVFRNGDEFAAGIGAIRAPRAIFLDVKMPGLTGHEVLSWIRARPEFDTVPVIMWSSSDDPTDISRASEEGAQCYVAKYPTVDGLADILREADRFRTDPSSVLRSRANLLCGREARAGLVSASPHSHHRAAK